MERKVIEGGRWKMKCTTEEGNWGRAKLGIYFRFDYRYLFNCLVFLNGRNNNKIMVIRQENR